MRGTFGALTMALLATALAGCDLVAGGVATPSQRYFEPPVETEAAIVTDVIDGDTIRVDLVGGRQGMLVRYIVSTRQKWARSGWPTNQGRPTRTGLEAVKSSWRSTYPTPTSSVGCCDTSGFPRMAGG